MDVETVEAIDRLGDRMDRLGDRIDRLELSLRGGMADMRAELRRHTDVVAESLRDDIRLVAEGVAHLSVKFDRLSR